MCRNIKTLYNFNPPATDKEIRASALQYVRKVSGFRQPSQANRIPYDRAIEEISTITRHLLDSLVTNSPPRDRDIEAAKARARAEKRFR
jgi:hypothetical protein